MSYLKDLLTNVLLTDTIARGFTAAELENAGYGAQNNITAALHQLWKTGVAYREKCEDEHRKPFRYWHVSNVVDACIDYPEDDEPEQAEPAPARPLPDVLITLAVGNNEALTCTLSDARGLHVQLSALFGA